MRRLAKTEPVIVPSLREAFAYSPRDQGGHRRRSRPVARRYAERLAADAGRRAYVTRSLPEFVEILDPAVDKGDALRFVAARLGVAIDETSSRSAIRGTTLRCLRPPDSAIAMGSAPPRACGSRRRGRRRRRARRRRRSDRTVRARREKPATPASGVEARRPPRASGRFGCRSRSRRAGCGAAAFFVDVAGLRSAARRRYAATARRARGEILARAAIAPHVKHVAAEHRARSRAALRRFPTSRRRTFHRMPPASVTIAVSERSPFAVRSQRRQTPRIVDRALRVLDARRTGVRVRGARDQAGFELEPGRSSDPSDACDPRDRLRRDDCRARVVPAACVRPLRRLRRDAPGGPRLLLGNDDDLEKKLSLVEPILVAGRAHQRRSPQSTSARRQLRCRLC